MCVGWSALSYTSFKKHYTRNHRTEKKKIYELTMVPSANFFPRPRMTSGMKSAALVVSTSRVAISSAYVTPLLRVALS